MDVELKLAEVRFIKVVPTHGHQSKLRNPFQRESVWSWEIILESPKISPTYLFPKSKEQLPHATEDGLPSFIQNTRATRKQAAEGHRSVLFIS